MRKQTFKFKILVGKNKVKEKEREKATNLNKIVILEKVNSWFSLASFFFLVCSLFTNYISLLLSM